MRKSKVLAKWRRGEFARFCALGHVLPFFVRYAAQFNFDGIWLDLEHRAMDDREVQHLLALCQMFDIDCMIRTPTLQRTRLYRYLEDGATGLMIPFVSDVQTAREVVLAAKFPPLGNRGLDGVGLDSQFGIDAWQPDSHYTEDANRETFIVAQIETPEAVDNLSEIATVAGIDALFIGPGDLGLRLSVAESPAFTMDEVVAKVAEAARAHGKVWGRTAGSPEELAGYLKLGAQIVPWGVDFALVGVLEQASQELDAVLAAASGT